MMDDTVLEEPSLTYGSVTVPTRLLGCWYRRYIRFPDGTEDTSTRVIWVQTLSGVGDIRVPATRPDLRARSGLADCSKEELLALAEQDCFCGVTLFNSKAKPFPTASWPKESYLFRFQPVITFPEPGWMEWLEGGTCMIERAPSGAYVEDWRLQPASQAFGAHLTRSWREIAHKLSPRTKRCWSSRARVDAMSSVCASYWTANFRTRVVRGRAANT
jgi:hypothetical protein